MDGPRDQNPIEATYLKPKKIKKSRKGEPRNKWKRREKEEKEELPCNKRSKKSSKNPTKWRKRFRSFNAQSLGTDEIRGWKRSKPRNKNGQTAQSSEEEQKRLRLSVNLTPIRLEKRTKKKTKSERKIKKSRPTGKHHFRHKWRSPLKSQPLKSHQLYPRKLPKTPLNLLWANAHDPNDKKMEKNRTQTTKKWKKIGKENKEMGSWAFFLTLFSREIQVVRIRIKRK